MKKFKVVILNQIEHKYIGMELIASTVDKAIEIAKYKVAKEYADDIEHGIHDINVVTNMLVTDTCDVIADLSLL